MVTTSTTTSDINDTIKPIRSTVESRQQEIINNLIKLAQKEQANGNTSITTDKLAKLSDLLAQKQQSKQKRIEHRNLVGNNTIQNQNTFL